MKGGDLTNYIGRGEMGSRRDAERCFTDLLGDSGTAGPVARQWAAKAAELYASDRDKSSGDLAGMTSASGRARVRVRFPWEPDSAGIVL